MSNWQKHLKYILDETSTVFTLDKEGHIINPLFCSERIFGYSHREMMGKNFFTLVAEEDEDEAKTAWINIIHSPNQASLKTKLRIYQKENSWAYYELTLTNLLLDADVGGVLVKGRDVTKEKELEKEVERLANHDPLTNLPNRQFFEKRLDLEISLAHHKENMFALLLLHVNQLPLVNQMFGTEYGDELLIQITQCLKKVTHSGTQIFRLGDASFALITPPVLIKDDVPALARQVLNLFKQPFQVGEDQIHTSASIGISIYPEHGQDRETLQRSAQLALDRAKGNIGSRYQIYSPRLQEQYGVKYKLSADLHKTLTSDQLEVFYQPRVHYASNEIIGVEASLVWHHPELGELPAHKFMPLAQQFGLASQLQKWFVQQVYQAASDWDIQRLPSFKMAIQASSFALLPETVHQLKALIEQRLVEPSHLEIGLKETDLTDQEGEAISFIQELQEMGLTFAIEYMGQGLLSLSRIKQLGIETVKLEPMFLELAEEDADLLLSMIKWADLLELDIIATGLDNQEQHKLLRQVGGIAVQGNLYSQPISKSECKRLLDKGVCYPQRDAGDFENLREYFRVELFYPLRAEMTISEIKGKKADLGKTDVLIEDIGPGGIRFMSHIRLPVSPEILLHFTMVLFNQQVDVKGHTVWSRRLKNGLYVYGLKFIIAETEQQRLTGLLNQLQIQLKKQLLLPDCDFVTIGAQAFFKKLTSAKKEKPEQV